MKLLKKIFDIKKIKYYFLFTFISFFYINILFCQNNIKTDSLQLLINSVSESIKYDSLFDSLYYWRAFTYYQAEKYDSAFNDIDIAIKLAKKEKGAYLFLKGGIYEETNDYKNSAYFYKKAFELDSLNYSILIELINSFVQQKEYKTALMYLEKGLASVTYRTGYKITVTSGLWPYLYVIVDIFRQGYTSDTTQYNALYGMGYTYFLKKDMDSAGFYLEKYIEKSPVDSIIPETFSMLGAVYLNEDSINKAIVYFKKAYENNVELSVITKGIVGIFDTNTVFYYYEKGANYYLNDNMDSTILFLEKYRSNVPVDSVIPNTYLMLGTSYLYKNDTAKAIENLKKAQAENIDISGMLKEAEK